MKLTVVAAHDPNLVIGKDGTLPWHYSEDLKHFKNTTMGGVLLMGRIVYESIGEKPLPGRRNIVLTRTKTYDNVEHYSSLEKAFAHVNEDENVFVIGGAALYEELLPKSDKLVITLVKKEYDGDTWFPEYRQDIGKIWFEADRRETDDLIFVTYERNNY